MTSLRPLRSTVDLEVVGDAAPRVAWERYADLDAWSGWSPQITRVTAARRRLAPGLTGTVHGPLGTSVPFVVLDVDEAARRWAWRVRIGPVRLHLQHAVTAVGGTEGVGCATRLVVRGWTPLVLGYVPLARLALGRLVRA